MRLFYNITKSRKREWRSKCNAHLAESLFQTGSKVVKSKKSVIYLCYENMETDKDTGGKNGQIPESGNGEL